MSHEHFLFLVATDPQFYLSVHESLHIVYERALGFNPRMSGPGWFIERGRKGWQDGSVEFLPQSISMTAGLVPVGKSAIGPACFLTIARHQHESPGLDIVEIRTLLRNSVQETLREPKFGTDLAVYNAWEIRRYRQGDDVSGLFTKITDSVCADYCDSEFHENVLRTAQEYARTVGTPISDDASSCGKVALGETK
jgi:hypothetical protein